MIWRKVLLGVLVAMLMNTSGVPVNSQVEEDSSFIVLSIAGDRVGSILASYVQTNLEKYGITTSWEPVSRLDFQSRLGRQEWDVLISEETIQHVGNPFSSTKINLASIEFVWDRLNADPRYENYSRLLDLVIESDYHSLGENLNNLRAYSYNDFLINFPLVEIPYTQHGDYTLPNLLSYDGVFSYVISHDFQTSYGSSPVQIRIPLDLLVQIVPKLDPLQAKSVGKILLQPAFAPLLMKNNEGSLTKFGAVGYSLVNDSVAGMTVANAVHQIRLNDRLTYDNGLLVRPADYAFSLQVMQKVHGINPSAETAFTERIKEVAWNDETYSLEISFQSPQYWDVFFLAELLPTPADLLNTTLSYLVDGDLVVLEALDRAFNFLPFDAEEWKDYALNPWYSGLYELDALDSELLTYSYSRRDNLNPGLFEINGSLLDNYPLYKTDNSSVRSVDSLQTNQIIFKVNVDPKNSIIIQEDLLANSGVAQSTIYRNTGSYGLTFHPEMPQDLRHMVASLIDKHGIHGLFSGLSIAQNDVLSSRYTSLYNENAFETLELSESLKLIDEHRLRGDPKSTFHYTTTNSLEEIVPIPLIDIAISVGLMIILRSSILRNKTPRSNFIAGIRILEGTDW